MSGVANAMNVDELVANGMSRRDANLEMHRRVFGHDVRFDKQGKVIENGVGGMRNMNRASIEAYKKFCSHEPGYLEHLAKMEKAYADCQLRRAREREQLGGEADVAAD